MCWEMLPGDHMCGGVEGTCRSVLMLPFPGVLGVQFFFSGGTFSHREVVPILKHAVWKFCTSPCYRLSRSDDDDGEDTSI